MQKLFRKELVAFLELANIISRNNLALRKTHAKKYN
jgi:hypothetical protein